MSGWSKVRWTQARQVTRLMGVKDADAPAETVAPADHCAALAAAGRLEEAVGFVGQALPRFEGVAWAAAQVDALRGAAPLPASDAAAMAAVRDWIAEPDDARRRAAFEAGEAAEDDGPARLLALAVWFSGGSMAPAGLQAVNPSPELSGRAAATAVLAAAHRTPDAAGALARALAAGEAIARGTPPPGAHA